MNTGVLLRYYRKLKNLSQFEVAEMANINEKYYSKIERDENHPTYMILNKIVTALDMKMTQFAIAADDYCQYDYIFFPKETRTGEFIKEVSPRFVGEVILNGKMQKVYMACSSRMSSMILLENSKINLSRNSSNSKYEYTLFSLDHSSIKIILNLNVINDMFYELYCLGNLSGYHWYGEGKAEIICENYKTDYYFPQERIIIENKTIISGDVICKYPIDNAKRSEKQFERLASLLDKYYDVRINFFVLSPWTNKLLFSESFELKIKQLEEAGAKFFFYYLFYEKDILKVRRIKVIPKNEYNEIVFYDEE